MGASLTTPNKEEHREEVGEVAGNLPVSLTRLVGRDGALAELRGVVWGTRLLTLCGPGGNGKTRLAVALADALRADFIGGAWWVDLSSTSTQEAVAQVVAGTLDPGAPNADPVSAIVEALSGSALLVLDNCEQVSDASAGLIRSLLERVSSLRVIATSRQPLRVPGERVWRVPGLNEGAHELFVERAREASSLFDPDAAGARRAIDRICGSLDGMPLAIELAAARIAVLSPGQIAERLERDMALLSRGSHQRPARQRSLRATLDWSYELLPDHNRAVFRRLSALPGAFTLAAAEAVAGEADALDWLADLVDHSLIQVVGEQSEPRYRLLATIRSYAAEKLEESGEGAATRERMAVFFARLVENARSDLDGRAGQRWFEVLEADYENVIESLGYLATRDPARAARLTLLLWPFWYQRGHYREARQWFEAALAQATDGDPKARGALLIGAASVLFLQCEYASATGHLKLALELLDEDTDREPVAVALQRLGAIAREQGRYADARRLHERSLAIWRELGDGAGIASAQDFLGFVAWLSGEPAAGEELCSAALREFRRLDSLSQTAGALINLGACALYRGEAELACERFEEALRISRRVGFQEGIAWALHELAIAGRLRRRPARENVPLLREALHIHRRLGDRWRSASVLEELAGAALSRSDPRLAVEVLAAVESQRSQLGAPVPPVEAPDREEALERLRARLSETGFSAAYADGLAADIDELLSRAVAALDALDGSAARGGDGGAGTDGVGELGAGAERRMLAPALTRRELAVLELLSGGATNAEIAGALYISTSTAGVHVSNILRKLGAKRRVDAAGRAHQLGLLPIG